MGTPFSHLDERAPQPTHVVGWTIDRVRAVARAYRWARGIGMQPAMAAELAVYAHMADGGTHEEAQAQVPKMIRSVGEWHTSWLRRPRLDREVREEEALQRLGWWPPPKDIKGRQVWAEEAIKRAFTPPPDRGEIDKRWGDIQRRYEGMLTEARRRAEAAELLRQRNGGGQDHQPLGPSIASCSPDEETPQRS